MNVQMMTGYALKVDPNTKYDAFSLDALAKAAEVAVFGMAMVFLVLIILWGVLAVFQLIFAGETKKKAEVKTEEAIPVKVAEPEPVAVAQDDTQLIAVLTAAIEAYRASESCGDENYASGFRVVSFKRVGAGRPWNSK